MWIRGQLAPNFKDTFMLFFHAHPRESNGFFCLLYFQVILFKCRAVTVNSLKRPFN